MVSAFRVLILVLCVAAFAAPVCAQQIDNWPAPASWSPEPQLAAPGSRHALSAEGIAAMQTYSPLPFIGVTPCRIADTRDGLRPPGYGPPSLAAGAPRNFVLTGQCGIAATAQAVSLNVTVTNTLGPGFILIYPQGGTQPLVSTLNYVANQTVANAAVVPLGTGGGVTVVAGVSGTDLIIDTNGYYAGAGVGGSNTFLGLFAGNFTMTGDNNTGFGNNALFSNTTGFSNTAIGVQALFSNTTGNQNTAIGVQALFSNTGSQNTAIGLQALFSNTTGINNTALGRTALQSNTTGGNNTASGSGALVSNVSGNECTASGEGALFSNTTGSANTASGKSTLVSNTSGFNNTAFGRTALSSNTIGSGNIAVGLTGGVGGVGAGSNLTTGNNNIDIGNAGVAGESATIRIGTDGNHTRAFLAGVQGVTTGGTGTPVLIDANGQLGTISSSARFKDEIQDMGEATEGLLRLRPVTFRYKVQPEGRTQFGLIAEEVEKVMPELVVCSSSGEVETVLYHELPAMLLNELQKQQREVQKQQRDIQELKSELSALRAALGQK